MQKLTMQEMQKSFVQIELNKAELLLLLYLYAQGSDPFLDDECFSEQDTLELESSLKQIQSVVDQESFEVSDIEKKMNIKKLLQKLLLVNVSAVSQKH